MVHVARLFWRTNRFEVIAILLATASAAMAGWLIAERLRELAPSAACLPLLIGGSTSDQLDGCPTLTTFVQFRQDAASPVLLAIGQLPVVVGALLGARIVAPEIEQRTAVLAWSIVPSRHRWLMTRALVPIVIVLTSSATLGVISERLAQASAPGLAVAASFEFTGNLSPVLVARGFVGLGAGLVIGAIIGRTVPALLVGLAVAFALSTAGALGSTVPAARVLVDDPGGSRDQSAIYEETVMRSADGRLVSFAQASAEAPRGLDVGDRTDWVYTNFRAMAVIIPGSEAPMAVARNVLLVVAASALLVLATSFVVGRRRPY
jgi:hypothetical protein